MTGDGDAPALLPMFGESVVEGEGIVVTGGVVGVTASGSPYARAVGDNVPAFVTTLGVAADTMAFITESGAAVGAEER